MNAKQLDAIARILSKQHDSDEVLLDNTDDNWKLHVEAHRLLDPSYDVPTRPVGRRFKTRRAVIEEFLRKR